VRRGAISGKIAIDVQFWKVAVEHLWTLARAGAIALSGGAGDIPWDGTPGGVSRPGARSDVPELVITALGERVLSERSASPHDWAKYEAAVRTKVPNPDDTVLVHLGEAVRAWQSSLHRASAVMLGCAVERLIIMLGETMRDASLPAPADTLRKKLASPKVGISDIYDIVRETLGHLTDGGRLPGNLAETWERRLTPAFEQARLLRNRSGHPTGEQVSGDDALSGLLLFPGFHELVDKLITVIRGLAAPAATPPAGPGGERETSGG
jgi:hypothetical protein